jgi:NTP pyrophosphatase (non-canonical NTP hydrolase)
MSEKSTSVHELQADIAEWADKLNPHRTALSIIAKMLEELGELIASDRQDDPLELADVLILALDLAHIKGIDLTDAVQRKMRVNRNRVWRIADNGAMKHVSA